MDNVRESRMLRRKWTVDVQLRMDHSRIWKRWPNRWILLAEWRIGSISMERKSAWEARMRGPPNPGSTRVTRCWWSTGCPRYCTSGTLCQGSRRTSASKLPPTWAHRRTNSRMGMDTLLTLLWWRSWQESPRRWLHSWTAKWGRKWTIKNGGYNTVRMVQIILIQNVRNWNVCNDRFLKSLRRNCESWHLNINSMR